MTATPSSHGWRVSTSRKNGTDYATRSTDPARYTGFRPMWSDQMAVAMMAISQVTLPTITTTSIAALLSLSTEVPLGEQVGQEHVADGGVGDEADGRDEDFARSFAEDLDHRKPAACPLA